ncbi:MAG: hypothetical protein A2W25_09870 [candidate division Zixibacteria bacterium RBG_16_53_22]|nr:MAG: hypothetical protein A2W25_09870 [candidate division Zixibacteria bacterium RBG_16_53_22]
MRIVIFTEFSKATNIRGKRQAWNDAVCNIAGGPRPSPLARRGNPPDASAVSITGFVPRETWCANRYLRGFLSAEGGRGPRQERAYPHLLPQIAGKKQGLNMLNPCCGCSVNTIV